MVKIYIPPTDSRNTPRTSGVETSLEVSNRAASENLNTVIRDAEEIRNVAVQAFNETDAIFKEGQLSKALLGAKKEFGYRYAERMKQIQDSKGAIDSAVMLKEFDDLNNEITKKYTSNILDSQVITKFRSSFGEHVNMQGIGAVSKAVELRTQAAKEAWQDELNYNLELLEDDPENPEAYANVQNSIYRGVAMGATSEKGAATMQLKLGRKIKIASLQRRIRQDPAGMAETIKYHVENGIPLDNIAPAHLEGALTTALEIKNKYDRVANIRETAEAEAFNEELNILLDQGDYAKAKDKVNNAVKTKQIKSAQGRQYRDFLAKYEDEARFPELKSTVEGFNTLISNNATAEDLQAYANENKAQMPAHTFNALQEVIDKTKKGEGTDRVELVKETNAGLLIQGKTEEAKANALQANEEGKVSNVDTLNLLNQAEAQKAQQSAARKSQDKKAIDRGNKQLSEGYLLKDTDVDALKATVAASDDLEIIEAGRKVLRQNDRFEKLRNMTPDARAAVRTNVLVDSSLTNEQKIELIEDLDAFDVILKEKPFETYINQNNPNIQQLVPGSADFGAQLQIRSQEKAAYNTFTNTDLFPTTKEENLAMSSYYRNASIDEKVNFLTQVTQNLSSTEASQFLKNLEIQGLNIIGSVSSPVVREDLVIAEQFYRDNAKNIKHSLNSAITPEQMKREVVSRNFLSGTENYAFKEDLATAAYVKTVYENRGNLEIDPDSKDFTNAFERNFRLIAGGELATVGGSTVILPAGVDQAAFSQHVVKMLREGDIQQNSQLSNDQILEGLSSGDISIVSFGNNQYSFEINNPLSLSNDPLRTGKYGLRADGVSFKGEGYLGEIMLADGSVATEISVHVDDVEIPTLVPGLSEEQLNFIVAGGDPRDRKDIMDIAINHARERIELGLSPFKQANQSEIVVFDFYQSKFTQPPGFVDRLKYGVRNIFNIGESL